MDLREQCFGLELEFTGISRHMAGRVLAEHFHVGVQHTGGCYDKYIIYTPDGRAWTILSDCSIRVEAKASRMIPVDDTYKCEFVTPICKYTEIETIQEIVRKLRKAGAMVNSSCGIHVHVDGAAHTVKSLKNLLKIINAKQELIFRSLNVDSVRERYCKKLEQSLLERAGCSNTIQKLENAWYANSNSNRNSHYNDSRYHIVNLHSFFQNKNIEFRCFNATLHAGEVKSYIQLSLAISAQAINQKSATGIPVQTDNDKYAFRCWLLRLGLIGDEYKTARLHLLKNLSGNSAWRYGQPVSA